jgi:hypothetical protein
VDIGAVFAEAAKGSGASVAGGAINVDIIFVVVNIGSVFFRPVITSRWSLVCAIFGAGRAI